MSQIIRNGLDKLKVDVPKDGRMTLIMGWVPNMLRPFIGVDSGVFLLLEDPSLLSDDPASTPTNAHQVWDDLLAESEAENDS